MIEAGIASLKIEGRMKSINYLAFIISSYRKCIDDYYNNQKMDFDYYNYLMMFAENRLTSYGFIHGNVGVNQMLYDLDHDFTNAGNFIGIVRKADDKYAYLEVKNKIKKGETYFKLSSGGSLEEIKILEMNYKGEEVEVYTVAGELLQIKCDKNLSPYDIIHVVKRYETK